MSAAGLSVDPQAIVREHWRDADDGGRWVCVACGGLWRVGAAMGGCEARLLALRVIALEAALAKWDRWANPPFVPGAAWPVGEE